MSLCCRMEICLEIIRANWHLIGMFCELGTCLIEWKELMLVMHVKIFTVSGQSYQMTRNGWTRPLFQPCVQLSSKRAPVSSILVALPWKGVCGIQPPPLASLFLLLIAAWGHPSGAHNLLGVGGEGTALCLLLPPLLLTLCFSSKGPERGSAWKGALRKSSRSWPCDTLPSLSAMLGWSWALFPMGGQDGATTPAPPVFLLPGCNLLPSFIPPALLAWS